MKGWFKPALAALMAVAAWAARLLGGWDAALSLMFLMMALDVVSGLALAFLRRSDKTPGGGFRSHSFFCGLSRKMMMVLLVMVGTALDMMLGTGVCRLCVIGFYSANEALSVVENAAVAGVPFPKGLLAALERFRDQNDRASDPELEK